MVGSINKVKNSDFNWTTEQIQSKLTAIGKLENKQKAWICTDLSLSSSTWFGRMMWTLFAKHFDWTRKLFYNVQLEKSKQALLSIKTQIDSSQDPQIIVLYNKAIQVFNQIAPRHHIEESVKMYQPKHEFKKINLDSEQIKSEEVEVAAEEVVEEAVEDSQESSSVEKSVVVGENSAASIKKGNSVEKTAAAVHQKAMLVLSAQQWLNNSSNQKKARQVTKSEQGHIQAAQKILQDIVQKQQEGIAVPLPFYYHSTKEEYIELIANDGVLKKAVSKASMGPGVYFSTNDETGTYGDGYTFVFDDTIENQPAFYFTGPRWRSQAYEINKYDGLWVSVQEDVNVTPKTVSYIVTNQDKIETVKAKIAKTPLKDVPVIDRKVANVVRYALDHALTKRNYPEGKWTPHRQAVGVVNRHDGFFLPKNAQHFAALKENPENNRAHNN